MARYTGPKYKQVRADKARLAARGEKAIETNSAARRPGQKHRDGLPGKDPKARSKKLTEYGMQLREKQHLKWTYELLEKQFRRTFDEAARIPGKTGENLIVLLERRLDNVVYRLHFASTRRQASQLVSHGHVFVNGKRVNIRSYRLKAGDVVSIGLRGQKMNLIKENLTEYTRSGVAPWLSLDPDAMKGTFVAAPQRSDIPDLANVNEQLIVELYSR